MARPKLNADYVKKDIESNGERLLSEYNFSYEDLKIECKNGHIYYKTWDNHKQGSRCRTCKNNSQILALDYIKNKIES